MVYYAEIIDNKINGYYTVEYHGLNRCEELEKYITINEELHDFLLTMGQVELIRFKDAQTEYTLDDVDLFQAVKNVYEFPKSDVEILQEKVVALTDENAHIKLINEQQDEMINIGLMATDEIYTMIEPFLQTSTLSINSLYLKEVNNPMVDMYVAMVLRNLKTIEEVPVRYREQVKAILAKLEE